MPLADYVIKPMPNPTGTYVPKLLPNATGTYVKTPVEAKPVVPTYQTGSTGTGVTQLQTALKNAGYNITADGDYGPQTEGIVKQYQKDKGLTIDGVAGSQTLGSLYNANTSVVPAKTNISQYDQNGSIGFAGAGKITDANGNITGVDVAKINNARISAGLSALTPAQEAQLNTGFNITAQLPTDTGGVTSTGGVDISGLSGLREYGEHLGLDIGWSPETGPTVNGESLDTSKLKYKDGHWYGDLSTLDSLFKSAETPVGNEFVNQEYKGRWDDTIAGLIEKFLNPEPFDPNVKDSESYKSYEKQYTQLGQNAYQDAIGTLSALTGGRPSTAAASAAGQQQNAYMQQLSNVIPQLEQQEYGRYQDKYTNLATQLATLQGLDTNEYARFADKKLFDYGISRDAVGDTQWQDTFDYGVGRDVVADKQYTEGLDYQKDRDTVSDEQWNATFTWTKTQDEIANGLSERTMTVNEANAKVQLQTANLSLEILKANKNTADDEYNASKPATPKQWSNYYQWKEIIADGPAAAFQALSGENQDELMKSLGSNLYEKLMGDIVQGGATQDLLVFYTDMMNSEDPVAWFDQYVVGMTDAEREYLTPFRTAYIGAQNQGIDQYIPGLLKSNTPKDYLAKLKLTSAQYNELLDLYNKYAKIGAPTSVWDAINGTQ